MPWGIERLRLAIVALAVLLLAAIVGSIFYGRWRLRHVAQDLPARLGLQIQQTTQGFVLSKTEKGQPVFTLHAARAVEFKSGSHVSLHNVEIDIFNRQDGKADTIAGDSFEYDPHSQVVQSAGEAHIVLHAPAGDAGAGTVSKTAGQLVRVTTHQLTFDQKTGVATCSGEVDFQTGDSTGQAVGAEYDSKAGQLLLVSQVVLTTAMQGRPAVLHASRATYDRSAGQVHLWQPRYSSQQERGAATGAADAAIVLLRRNGSAERLDATGAVRLTSTDGLRISASALRVLLNPASQPQRAQFSGGVEFAADQPTQKTSGTARQLEVDFDTQGRADRALFDTEVRLSQLAEAGKGHVQRKLASDHMVLHLLPSKRGLTQLQSADAAGNAVFTSQSVTPGQAPQETTFGGQTLNAQFAAGNQLQQMTGAGQTRLKTVAANGDIDSSTGDTLRIEFAPDMPAKAGKPVTTGNAAMKAASNTSDPMAAQSIRTAVQTGHVVLTQIAGRRKDKTSRGTDQTSKAGSPTVSTATAARASYVAASDTLTLTGSPMFRDAQIEMTADRMEVERSTGKMVSTGAVQATLLVGDRGSGNPARSDAGALLNGNQPVHIIAERATLNHATQEAVFSGRARLWQGDDSVAAPVIELSQKMQTLTAYSDRPCVQCVISDFSGQTGTPGTAASKTAKPSTSSTPSTFHVLSARLAYSDAERKASFQRNVQVTCSSGVLTADNAVVFLTPAGRDPENPQGKTKISPSQRNNPAQSSVERIIATDKVRLRQPGRDATGTRLVYTASDGHFVLTGDEKHLPIVIDVDQGTVSGQVLTFASPQQAIIVSGTAAQTTTTETRVKKK